MKRYSAIFLLLSASMVSQAQLTPTNVDQWIATWPFASPENVDSIPNWVEKLRAAEISLDYARAGIYATKLSGYFYDHKGDVEKATQLYLQFLEGARKHQLLDDEVSAVLDLVYVYLNTSQHDLAKQLLQEYIPKLNHSSVSQRTRSALYNNLGVTYVRLNLLDSAIIAYNQALEIKKLINDSAGMADLRINLASILNRTQNFRESLRLSEENISFIEEKGDSSDLVYNLINKGGAHYGLGDKSLAEKHLMSASQIAEKLNVDHLKQRSYLLLTNFYSDQRDFQNAYKYLVINNELKQRMFDEQTNTKIAELREKYEATKREQENVLLTTNLVLEQNTRQKYLLGIIATTLLALTIAWAWFKNRSKNIVLQQQNALITTQKDTLTRLNSEKNTLISMVSHDLSSPLNAIRIWALGLSRDPEDEFEEAKNVILSTSNQALQTVKKILTIEAGEMHLLQLEEVTLSEIFTALESTFSKQAMIKTIKLEVTPYQNLIFVTDREMLLRALENLLSNAIKFSPHSSKVTIHCQQQDQKLSFFIRDQGPGINAEEQDQVFREYFQGNAKPTSGESSTGLGLSIVKRIAAELGAEVSVSSTPPHGATFSFSVRL